VDFPSPAVLVNPYYRHHGPSNISTISSAGSRVSRSPNQDNRLCYLAHHLEPATRHITGWLRTRGPNTDTIVTDVIFVPNFHFRCFQITDVIFVSGVTVFDLVSKKIMKTKIVLVFNDRVRPFSSLLAGPGRVWAVLFGFVARLSHRVSINWSSIESGLIQSRFF
jgi:hypothetical protein